MKAKHWHIGVFMMATSLTACSPQPPEQAIVQPNAASEIVEQQPNLVGETEKLNFNLPECQSNHCPELNIERLKSNQAMVDTWIDEQIFALMQQQFSVIPKAKIDNLAASEAASVVEETNKKKLQQVMTAKTELQEKLGPYVEAFSFLDQELKELSANQQISMMIKPRILPQQGHLATVVLTSSSYLGGAHGSSSQQYANFDLTQKRKLLLKDVIVPEQKANFEKIAYQHFSQWVLDNQLASSVAEYEQAWKFHLTDNFYFGKQGLILQYAEYEIGPYVTGLPKLLLPYEELKGIIQQPYLTKDVQP